MVLDCYRRADTIISPSDHLAELASAQGLGPVQVIRHGLDDSWFGPRQPISADAPFVHIGTIAHHKGTDLVVAAHRALKDGPGLELHGPILDPESALGHPVGRRLEPSGVQSRLRQARALVLGSRWTENAPLIVIEARAAGCPVIAPRIGGIPELITEGVDGILYEPGDIEGLTAAMRALLEQPMLEPSPPPRFTDQVDRLEAVYRQALRQTA